MSRQDKATSEKFTRTLRELVKQPENKVCADCKRNDPRWASWNLGVFLCIRCSGIHRSMGTHISKVKSVDLDIWTPEQMESIQRWGNRRANLYWEAHLKAGHVPPDHKMDSFIRSKYETKRWAMEGPPPRDPSVLDDGAPAASSTPAPAATPPPTNNITPSHRSSASITRHAQSPSQSVTSRQPQAHQLLSTSHVNNPARLPPHQTQSRTTAPAPAPVAQQAPPPPQNDLFSLDFHAPPPSTNASAETQPKKDVKQDILSLFSTSTPAVAPAQLAFSAFGQSSPWDTTPQHQVPHQQAFATQPTSMMGQNGTGMWGVNSGWSAPAPPTQANLWSSAAPTQQASYGVNPLANTNAVWGASTASAPAVNDLFGGFATATPATTASKKDDVFGDIWGGFK